MKIDRKSYQKGYNDALMRVISDLKKQVSGIDEDCTCDPYDGMYVHEDGCPALTYSTKE